MTVLDSLKCQFHKVQPILLTSTEFGLKQSFSCHFHSIPPLLQPICAVKIILESFPNKHFYMSLPNFLIKIIV